MEKLFPGSIAKVMIPIVHIAHESDVIIEDMLQADHKLTLADFKILMAVHSISECTQADVSRYKHVTEASVSKQVKLLVTKRLLKKVAHPDDARKTVLQLTPSGEVLVQQLLTDVVAKMETIFADFGKTERAHMAASLQRMLALVVAASPQADRYEALHDECLKEILGRTDK